MTKRTKLLFMFAAALVAFAASAREARAQFDSTQMTNDYLRMQNQVITHTTTRNAVRRQTYRAPQVYNPGRYNCTRRSMSNRAASRAATRAALKRRAALKHRLKRTRKAVRRNDD